MDHQDDNVKATISSEKIPARPEPAKVGAFVVFFVVCAVWLFALIRLSLFPNSDESGRTVLLLVGIGCAVLFASLGVLSLFGFPRLNKLWTGIVVTGFLGGIAQSVGPEVAASFAPAGRPEHQPPLKAEFILLDESKIEKLADTKVVLTRRSTESFGDKMNGIAGLIVVDNAIVNGKFSLKLYVMVHSSDGKDLNLSSFSTHESYSNVRGDYANYSVEEYYEQRYTKKKRDALLQTIANEVPNYQKKLVLPWHWDSQFRFLNENEVVVDFIIVDLLSHRCFPLHNVYKGPWKKLGTWQRLPTNAEIRLGRYEGLGIPRAEAPDVVTNG